jgi:hypothetical protein
MTPKVSYFKRFCHNGQEGKRTSGRPIFPFMSFYTLGKVLFLHIYMTQYLFRLLQNYTIRDIILSCNL